VKPVLILGAGINGAAVARDLAINGIPVCIVDTGDIARGATSRSSRLIHGGLRYLEYRDTDLVRESLLERERLLQLAPQFVTPLRLTIPVTRYFGGLWAGFVRFSGLARTRFGRTLLKYGRGPRGLLAIRVGLLMYDRLAGPSVLPPHQVRATHDSRFDTSTSPDTSNTDTSNTDTSNTDTSNTDVDDASPRLSRQLFRWQCSYSDAQIAYPERFVLALLEDGRRAAEQTGTRFEVLPYHRVITAEHSSTFSIEPLQEGSLSRQHSTAATRSIQPSVVINATGAWGDRTLETLGLRERQLFAGTKGSHLFTTHQPLVDALNGSGIYAEAQDGRLVFILPCADGVLIGTTDDPYLDDPGDAISTQADVDYLLKMVANVFPDAGLTAEHVAMHHAGVRPLPKCDSRSASAIPRGHSIEETTLNGIPILTLVGGKLTTCRSLAEQVCSIVCRTIDRPRRQDTADRMLPGTLPSRPELPLETSHQQLASEYGLSMKQVDATWKLVGNRFDEIFSSRGNNSQPTEVNMDRPESIAGTFIPRAFVNWSIAREWCTKLEDLVERRLMLIFQPAIRRETLRQLALELVHAGQLAEAQVENEIDRASQRLITFYGKSTIPD